MEKSPAGAIPAGLFINAEVLAPGPLPASPRLRGGRGRVDQAATVSATSWNSLIWSKFM